MSRFKTFAPVVASLSLAFTLASPAYAQGKADRARTAIAKAEAKIQSGDAVGANSLFPAKQTEARSVLATAKEDLAAGRKEEAIATANRAATIAETTIGQVHQQHNAETAATQQQAVDASAQAQQAQNSAAIAEQEAATANARARNAQQAAIASNARANAALEEANKPKGQKGKED